MRMMIGGSLDFRTMEILSLGHLHLARSLRHGPRQQTRIQMTVDDCSVRKCLDSHL